MRDDNNFTRETNFGTKQLMDMAQLKKGIGPIDPCVALKELGVIFINSNHLEEVEEIGKFFTSILEGSQEDQICVVLKYLDLGSLKLSNYSRKALEDFRKDSGNSKMMMQSQVFLE
ncbi:MAG: hypothetical protein UR60_C0021G0030 [Candidatus Moranbacteria bacterium GW2011_GWF2_34_56]|nr:MAG: hypothetical protein UR51_C0008G0003 [Candidatus Moranbacteria bacterium GW2011_GWF1_34_10]KKP64462.1 MAG: hypothetical protein UR60_C0021G0030 [Candidatus Moranbacteria bacterium GW2011_GWF2_34_56]HBI17109.1 hypothetical protein [Candidatus Moranbacteria bacterium]